ncbi:hypothetical protein V502_03393 [Pseudogymnoascus sp. VKM F-4520 (FW-2644)]|nr:hypothetical protein V502_03393 [Pseudogymnoascus sp. VKM F-4520 (FW-2644)]
MIYESSRPLAPIESPSLHEWVFGSASDPIPHKVAFFDAVRPNTHYLTVASWRQWSKRVAAGLKKAGLQPGDRVLVYSGNALFYPVIFMGIIMAGGIFTGANPTYVSRELAHQLKDSQPRFMVSSGASLEVALDAAGTAGFSKDNIFIFDDEIYQGSGASRLGVKYWDALVASNLEGSQFQWAHLKDPKNTTCVINYSSGTTGVAKGVEITHYNYMATSTQMINLMQQDPDYEKNLKVARGLCVLPLYHAFGQVLYCSIGPKRGIPIYIMPKFEFLEFLGHISTHRITELLIVPPIVTALAKHPAAKKADLSSVNYLSSGGAPLSSSLAREAETIWGGKLNIKQGYGMTETTVVATGMNPAELTTDSSVGSLVCGISARLVDPKTGKDAPVHPDSTGELWVRGPNIMKGYWRNPTATAGTISDGWLRTGDMARIENGRWFIVDRLKELIKVKGFQVAPAELEGLLLENPKVGDAGVVGVVIQGEECPRAYVALKPGMTATKREIAEFVEKQTTRYKWLTGGVVFVDEIPKNPSGKILRKALRDLAAKDSKL